MEPKVHYRIHNSLPHVQVSWYTIINEQNSNYSLQGRKVPATIFIMFILLSYVSRNLNLQAGLISKCPSQAT